jgi:hypothetical protein
MHLSPICPADDHEDMAFDDTTRQLVDGRNFAVVATLNPDGSPQTSVVWVGLDDDAVVFSSTANRHGRSGR